MTQDELKKILKYHPKNGLFTWTSLAGRRCVPGAIAGHTKANGEVVITIDGKKYYAHRLAWLYQTGKESALLIARKNNNKSNKWSDLTERTASQRAELRAERKDSKHRGISFHKASEKWIAYYKNKHLGSFPTQRLAEECAVNARHKC